MRGIVLAPRKHKDAVEAAHSDLELDLDQVTAASAAAAEEATHIADADAMQRASHVDDVTIGWGLGLERSAPGALSIPARAGRDAGSVRALGILEAKGADGAQAPEG